MTLRTMDEWAVRKRLKAACKAEGGSELFALKHRIHTLHIDAVIAGSVTPGPKLIAALGLYRVTRYARERKKWRAA